MPLKRSIRNLAFLKPCFDTSALTIFPFHGCQARDLPRRRSAAGVRSVGAGRRPAPQRAGIFGGELEGLGRRYSPPRTKTSTPLSRRGLSLASFVASPLKRSERPVGFGRVRLGHLRPGVVAVGGDVQGQRFSSADERSREQERRDGQRRRRAIAGPPDDLCKRPPKFFRRSIRIASPVRLSPPPGLDISQNGRSELIWRKDRS